MDAAAAFLAVRSRSVAETTRRLVRLGYPRPLVDEVVTRLVDMAYLDDEQFARDWVASRDRARPRGTAALKRELQLKGVGREVVDGVLAARDSAVAGSADMDAAMALLGRRRASIEREPDPRRRRARAYALLARTGFDAETCREASATVTKSDDE